MFDNHRHVGCQGTHWVGSSQPVETKLALVNVILKLFIFFVKYTHKAKYRVKCINTIVFFLTHEGRQNYFFQSFSGSTHKKTIKKRVSKFYFQFSLLSARSTVNSWRLSRGRSVAVAVGCWLFALQRHFNGTSAALPRHFNKTSMALKKKKKKWYR